MPIRCKKTKTKAAAQGNFQGALQAPKIEKVGAQVIFLGAQN